MHRFPTPKEPREVLSIQSAPPGGSHLAPRQVVIEVKSGIGAVLPPVRALLSTSNAHQASGSDPGHLSGSQSTRSAEQGGPTAGVPSYQLAHDTSCVVQCRKLRESPSLPKSLQSVARSRLRDIHANLRVWFQLYCMTKQCFESRAQSHNSITSRGCLRRRRSLADVPLRDS
jgi:hypothetical protein